MDRSSADLTELLGDWALRPGPLYRRLADAVRAAVQNGDLPAGERLPSERELARSLGVSRATVVSAYDDLRADAVIESRRGSGSRVAAGTARPDVRVHSVFQRLLDRRDEVISLAHTGDPAPPALRAALAEIDLDRLFADGGYHPAGLPALRTAVADRYARSGLPTKPDEILVTTGASQAIALVARMFLRRRSVVTVESPSWPGCLDVFRVAGARPAGVPVDEQGMRPELPSAASLVYVTPTFQNPTGILMSESRRRRIAALAARESRPILEDHALAVPIGRRDVPPPIAAFGWDGVMTVGSLTKSVWGGLRVGWIRAAPELIDRLARLKMLDDLGGPLLDQALATQVLPRLDDLVDGRADSLARRVDLLEELLRQRLPEWRWRRPEGGTALWIELPDTDARAFGQVALRHGVEIVPGAAMDPERKHDRWIRVPVTFPEEILEELVRRLAAAWHAGPVSPRGAARRSR